jgi:probable rRNA maturation factor
LLRTKSIAASPDRLVSNSIWVSNRQRAQAVNLPFLRLITSVLANEILELQTCELAIYIVGAREMTRLNEAFLKHQGSTDVLAFNYSEAEGPPLVGEIFVCADEARIQAARFHTDWQSELVRYIVHGTLHLMGYDDHPQRLRRKMKRRENHVLRQLSKRFDLRHLNR